MKSPKASSAMKMILFGTSKLLNLIVVVFLAVFLTFAPLALLQWAMQHHWAWGFPVVAFYCVVIYAGAREFRAGRLNRWQGVQTIAGGLLLTILVFTFLSFALNKFGAAHYQGFTWQSSDETLSVHFNFINFYLWQLFKLIPGVDINEAFGWKSPLEKFGFVAGLLLILFRVVIVFVFLKGFRDWWAKRSEDSSVGRKEARVRRWSTRGAQVRSLNGDYLTARSTVSRRATGWARLRQRDSRRSSRISKLADLNNVRHSRPE